MFKSLEIQKAAPLLSLLLSLAFAVNGEETRSGAINLRWLDGKTAPVVDRSLALSYSTYWGGDADKVSVTAVKSGESATRDVYTSPDIGSGEFTMPASWQSGTYTLNLRISDVIDYSCVLQFSGLEAKSGLSQCIDLRHVNGAPIELQNKAGIAFSPDWGETPGDSALVAAENEEESINYQVLSSRTHGLFRLYRSSCGRKGYQ